MKGIVLAGGSGTRLYPITKGVSKQLLPIYDKPMVYYPISILLLSGIRKILIISTPDDIVNYQKLLGDGKKLGIEFNYLIQEKPEGLAQAFVIGEDFIGKDSVCLVLGDNIFYGHNFNNILKKASDNVRKNNKATIFGYHVNDPNRYGVVEFDDDNNAISIEEKPEKPKSNFAVVGLYYYPNSVIEISKKIKPSKRGELEISSVNQEYLERKNLKVEILGREYAWLDTGTHESLADAGEFVKVIEKRQGLKIACLEEICFQLGYISKDQALSLALELKNTNYGQYLIKRIAEL